jgi:hypothetical protein
LAGTVKGTRSAFQAQGGWWWWEGCRDKMVRKGRQIAPSGWGLKTMMEEGLNKQMTGKFGFLKKHFIEAKLGGAQT